VASRERNPFNYPRTASLLPQHPFRVCKVPMKITGIA
ncbi:uncharacterized protein METZ01_LOCUS471000, partial [marine metagenome]